MDDTQAWSKGITQPLGPTGLQGRLGNVVLLFCLQEGQIWAQHSRPVFKCRHPCEALLPSFSNLRLYRNAFPTQARPPSVFNIFNRFSKSLKQSRISITQLSLFYRGWAGLLKASRHPLQASVPGSSSQ